MPRVSVGEKATRVLRFLMGLRDPRITAALGSHGFTEADRYEGYTLLRGLTDERLRFVPPAPRDLDALELLDRWENLWLPIAYAALQHHHPETHAMLFRDLPQARGVDLVTSVCTFLDRMESVRSWTDHAVADGIAHLAQRGLDAARLAEGRLLLETVQATLPFSERPAIDPDTALARERAVWTWYLEWSGIARAVVRDPRQLHELGLEPVGRLHASDEAELVPAV